jgi:hypothetical protein
MFLSTQPLVWSCFRFNRLPTVQLLYEMLNRNAATATQQEEQLQFVGDILDDLEKAIATPPKLGSPSPKREAGGPSSSSNSNNASKGATGQKLRSMIASSSTGSAAHAGGSPIMSPRRMNASGITGASSSTPSMAELDAMDRLSSRDTPKMSRLSEAFASRLRSKEFKTDSRPTGETKVETNTRARGQESDEVKKSLRTLFAQANKEREAGHAALAASFSSSPSGGRSPATSHGTRTPTDVPIPSSHRVGRWDRTQPNTIQDENDRKARM